MAGACQHLQLGYLEASPMLNRPECALTRKRAAAAYYGYLCPYGRVRRKYCVHVNIQPLADHFADGHHRSEALLERVHLLQHR